MIGSCNIDELDWGNREYPASHLSKKPYTLVNGEHRLTVRQVKPDPLMTLGRRSRGPGYSSPAPSPPSSTGERRKKSW